MRGRIAVWRPKTIDMDTGYAFFVPRLLAVLALIAANGFFVAVEFSLVTARRARMETMAGVDNPSVGIVNKMQSDVDLYIAAAQLGITVASLALGWIGEATIAELVRPLVERLVGPLWGQAAAVVIGTVLSLGLLTFLHIVLGEQAPKTFAIRNPERTALFSARIMNVFTRVFRPFIWVLDSATALVLRLFGVREGATHRSVHSVEELKLIVHESQAEGVLEETQEEMLVRVFEFGERYVTETMIPRTDIVGIPDTATVGDLLQVFNTAQHSRFPVFREDLDDITGIVAIKDVLLALAEGPHNRSRTLIELNLVHPAFTVPDSRKIGDLFSEMREQKVGMAIVIDEYGGTAGVVTLEELIEEVVGRVTDEWVVEPASVQAVSEGVFEVSAQTRIDEINQELDLHLPERDEYETLAGFLLYLMRRIPEPGTEATWDGLHFTVVQMKGPKIEQVRITRT